MDAKEEIRSRLNIEDVIGEYVQLKRAGRNFKGLSPFAQEKTPSFVVSPEKHIWHDFSSGKGGDVFSFIMEVEGMDFKAAIDHLARKAGVDLAQFRSGDSGLGKKKERLFAAADLAAKFYHQVFLRSQTALDYAKHRQLNKQVVQDFLVGYSPTQNELFAALTKRGFTEKELKDAGLVVNRRFGPGDMFRGRLMIPLMDAQGRVVGFTARILTADPHAPKYINTPQTLLYDKSRHVFGLHLAKEAIRQAGYTVVVEGQMDVLASHRAGFKQVVATAGTAMTEHHLRALSRFAPDVRLAFDADKAGVAATERAIALASNLGLRLGIVTIPQESDAKDADELIQKDPALWQRAIDTPKDAVEWLLDHYANRYDLASADGKRRATDQALTVVRTISDPVLLEHYIALIAARIGASPEALNKKMSQQPTTEVQPLKKSKRNTPLDPEKFKYQDDLLAMALAYPALKDILLNLDPACLAGDVRQQVAKYLADPRNDLLQSEEIRVKINELELIAEAKYPALSDELYYDAAGIAKRINREHKQALRQRLSEQLIDSDNDAARQQLNQQIKDLDKQIEALKR